MRGRLRQSSGEQNGGYFDPPNCCVCGIHSYLARDCPQQTNSLRGHKSNSGTQSISVHRGTSSNRSRGRRAQFGGLNVVCDARGHEYPVEDAGMLYFPTNGQNEVVC